MSIIREIKAAWRWVFPPKIEVKEEAEINRDEMYEDIDDIQDVVIVKRCVLDSVIYRYCGDIKTCKMQKDEFLTLFRKIS